MALASLQRGRKRPLTINRDLYPPENPRFVANETSSVHISAINVELRCPICLRLMREPMATECLHRFCKDCIEKCQRQAQKQCPSCRKPIATRRSLRPDPNIKRLIEKLYPDLDAFEAEEETKMLAHNKSYAEKHLANIIEKQVERQRALAASMQSTEPPPARQRLPPEGEDDADQGESGGGEDCDDYDDDVNDDGCSADEDGSDSSYQNETLNYEKWAFEGKPRAKGMIASSTGVSGARFAAGSSSGSIQRGTVPNEKILAPRPFEMAFHLMPHPKEGRLQSLEKDFITAPCLATVEHIHRFLASQLGSIEPASFELLITLPDNTHAVLQPQMTLHEIVNHFQLQNMVPDLLYKYLGMAK